MATHSSPLAWNIPWTEEPGRLQFMGSLGVGLRDLAAAAAAADIVAQLVKNLLGQEDPLEKG